MCTLSVVYIEVTRFLARHSLRRSVTISRQIHVGSVVDKVTVGQVSVRVLRL